MDGKKYTILILPSARPTMRDPLLLTAKSSKSKRITHARLLKLLIYLAGDGINGGYGIPAAILNLTEGFPPIHKYFIIPASGLAVLSTSYCSYKRTQSASKDSDGSDSFILFNIGIDLFTFFNFMLDLMAAIASAAMGPAADDAPWKTAGPIISGAALAGIIYARVATSQHKGKLNSILGKAILEGCQLLQVISAGTSLTQLVTGINPITLDAFWEIFLPSAFIGVCLRLVRSKYPVFYKIGDDILPVIAYLVQSGFSLSETPWIAALFFIVLLGVAFGVPIHALYNNKIGDEQIEAITKNPTLLPGKKQLMFQQPAEDLPHDTASPLKDEQREEGEEGNQYVSLG